MGGISKIQQNPIPHLKHGDSLLGKDKPLLSP